MAKVFFTYVWGPPGDPCWPLTFGTKGARTQAKNILGEGDFVVTVGTRQDPTEEWNKGRVLGVYQVTSIEVNTQDYVGQINSIDVPERAAAEFPYALHPIAVWEIASKDNLFSKLVGPLTNSHHLQARSGVVELPEDAAAALLALERRSVAIAEPTTILGRSKIANKNSKQAPKHEGEFSGSFAEHDVWYVYALALRDQRGRDLAYKIGYASDPAAREAAYNAPLAREVTGLKWHVALQQPTASEDDARDMEKALLSRFLKHKLASNGEIFSGLKQTDIELAIASALRPN